MCMQSLCVKHAKFLTSHMPILEYQSPMHKKKHKVRVFIIRYCINSQNFGGGGGKLEGLGGGGGGGEASPLHPPVDETLLDNYF